MGSITERFEYARRQNGLSYKVLGDLLNVTPDAIRKAIIRDNIKPVYLNVFSETYNINLDWLLTGEGEMLRTNHTITANIKGDGNTQVVGGGNASVGNGGVSSTKLIKELQDRILQLEGELKAKDDIIKMILSK